MNKLRLIPLFLFLFCLFPSLTAARDASDIVGDSFEETTGRGLVIHTNPSGVTVFIDGAERGVTPLAFENLPSGEHNIVLIREGYRERSFNVTLFSSSQLVVSIKMEEIRGLALVSVYKADGSSDLPAFKPQIFTSVLNETSSDISLSHDNKAILNLPVGYHTIKVRAFGWEDSSVSVLINEYAASPVDIFMTPAGFRLGNGTQSRKRFNPMNSNNLGINEYRFEVSAYGSGTVKIFNKNGTVVHSEQLDQFDTWAQSLTWNGRDTSGNPLPEGIYTVLIEAYPSQNMSETVQLKMETEIDHSLNIFPLSLMGGLPGLIFAPVPDVLPAGSYQLEAGVNYGYFHLPSKNIDEEDAFLFFGLPFGIGLRVSPLKNLETSVFFNFNPRIDTAGWGITGSLKYNILSGFPLDLAAGISYAWASKYGDNPLSPGRGVGLYVPLSMKHSRFSFIFTPEIFWRGPEGIVPALLLSAGVLYQNTWINTGFSTRFEFDFKEDSNNPRFFSGLEAHFSPPPSNLVFSVQAGLWTHGGKTGGYGGLSIGIIF